MKSVIVVLWLAFGVFLLTPIITTYVAGDSYDQVFSTIETEAETEVSRITGEVARGNRILLAFTAGDDFGVAIFSHYGDNYKYEEGTMSNGMGSIDVNLDTGWNIYGYKVTASGLYTADIRRGEGIYRTYAMTGGFLAVITGMAVALSRIKKRKSKEKQN